MYLKNFGLPNHIFENYFAVCLDEDTRQRKYAHVNTFGLPSALRDTRQMLRDPGSRYVFKCLPCVVHVAHGKTWNLPCVLFCRVFSCQAHGQAHAVCPLFAVCYFLGTRQMISLPCARFLAHGKRETHGKLAVSRSALSSPGFDTSCPLWVQIVRGNGDGQSA